MASIMLNTAAPSPRPLCYPPLPGQRQPTTNIPTTGKLVPQIAATANSRARKLQYSQPVPLFAASARAASSPPLPFPPHKPDPCALESAPMSSRPMLMALSAVLPRLFVAPLRLLQHDGESCCSPHLAARELNMKLQSACPPKPSGSNPLPASPRSLDIEHAARRRRTPRVLIHRDWPCARPAETTNAGNGGGAGFDRGGATTYR